MDKNSSKIYGILASFSNPESLLHATRKVTDAGYRRTDTYTPFPIEGLSEAMRLPTSWMPLAVLVGGIIGGLLGYGMQFFATVIDLPLNIGGRPLHSWPAYIPITFEVTVLFAAFGGLLALFLVTGLPQPYHPVFNSEDFQKHGSQDGFYLSISKDDPKYNEDETPKFLESLGAIQVTEIEA
jgi:hypothetical protein